MHDCNGKALGLFDKVRQATKEELEAAGHGSEGTAAWIPEEGVIVGALPGNACCEVTVASGLDCRGSTIAPDCSAGVMFIGFTKIGSCRGLQVVKVEG